MTAPLADAHAVAHEAAEWLVATLTATEGRLCVALSGGSTPKLLYEALASDAFARRVPWDRTHWFWGDERFVPPTDPASNYYMTSQAMLSHVPIPSDHIHPIPTEDVTPEESAAQYEATLRRLHESGDLAVPMFDVVLLGLGTNGHFASLFPDTPSLSERTAWAVPVTPDGERTRITLTFPVLESCRHAAFLVVGADKAAILRAVRDERRPEYPASHYRPAGALHWFTDVAAEGAAR